MCTHFFILQKSKEPCGHCKDHPWRNIGYETSIKMGTYAFFFPTVLAVYTRCTYGVHA